MFTDKTISTLVVLRKQKFIIITFPPDDTPSQTLQTVCHCEWAMLHLVQRTLNLSISQPSIMVKPGHCEPIIVEIRKGCWRICITGFSYFCTWFTFHRTVGERFLIFPGRMTGSHAILCPGCWLILLILTPPPRQVLAASIGNILYRPLNTGLISD